MIWKRAAAVLAAAAIALFLALGSVLSAPQGGEAQGETKFFGLFREARVAALPVITAADREAEYESRAPFSPEALDGMEEEVLSLLSAGNFDGADAALAELAHGYRDAGEEEGMAVSATARIDLYRADLAAVRSLPDAGAERAGALLRHFMTSEVLAAAVAYAPVSLKLDAFLNGDSLCLPGIYAEDAGRTNLTKLPLRPEEFLALTRDINLRRGDDPVTGVEVYTFQAFGIPCRLEIVCQADGTFAPYRLTAQRGALSDAFYRVSSLKSLRSLHADSDWFDLDAASYLAPPDDPQP